MISVFRREIRKLKFVWVILLISMALGSVGTLLFRRSTPHDTKIATVNGDAIYLPEFQREVSQVQMQFQQFGSADSLQFFLRMMGFEDIAQYTLHILFMNKVLDDQYRKLKLALGSEQVEDHIGKNIPPQLIEQDGTINQRNYAEYVRLTGHDSIAEFEEALLGAMRRSLVSTVIEGAWYAPEAEVREEYERENVKKSFMIAKIPFSHFLDKARTEKVSDEQLKQYFNEHRATYKIPEKRQGEYVEIPLKSYVDETSVSDDAVVHYYEKHKSDFRTPPQVEVRKLVLSIPAAASPDKLKEVSVRAQELYEQAKSKPDTFKTLARTHSEDKKTASHDGYVGIVKRGSGEDETFKRVALRLKEAGEISTPVRTSEGIVIIQLIKRYPATYKKLDEVRDQINTTLQKRQGRNALLADIRKVINSSERDKDALAAFAKRHRYTLHSTDLVASPGEKGQSIAARVTRQLFKTTRSAHAGYFEDTSRHVFAVYRTVKKVKSVVPSFKEVKDTVRNDHYAQQARKLRKTEVKAAKRALLSGKKSFKEIADSFGGDYEETGLLGISDEPPAGLKELTHFISRAFDLTDKEQVLKYRDEDTRYLIGLKNTKKPEKNEFSEKRLSTIASLRRSEQNAFKDAFIASLVRHATIEKDPAIFGDSSRSGA